MVGNVDAVIASLERMAKVDRFDRFQPVRRHEPMSVSTNCSVFAFVCLSGLVLGGEPPDSAKDVGARLTSEMSLELDRRAIWRSVATVQDCPD